MEMEELDSLLRDAAEFAEQESLADHPDASLDDLGVDSLAVYDVLAVIEERHGSSPTFDQVASARTPRALLDTINGVLAGRPLDNTVSGVTPEAS